jgi:hypothetical protein
MIHSSNGDDPLPSAQPRPDRALPALLAVFRLRLSGDVGLSGQDWAVYAGWYAPRTWSFRFPTGEPPLEHFDLLCRPGAVARHRTGLQAGGNGFCVSAHVVIRPQVDSCPVGGERGCDRLADPGCRAGHEGGSSAEQLAHGTDVRWANRRHRYRKGTASRVSRGTTAYCMSGITSTSEARSSPGRQAAHVGRWQVGARFEQPEDLWGTGSRAGLGRRLWPGSFEPVVEMHLCPFAEVGAKAAGAAQAR